jgi:hypothetical protein
MNNPKKREGRPVTAIQRKPEPTRRHDTASRPRRRGLWPDPPLRAFRDWPQDLRTFFDSLTAEERQPLDEFLTSRRFPSASCVGFIAFRFALDVERHGSKEGARIWRERIAEAARFAESLQRRNEARERKHRGAR